MLHHGCFFTFHALLFLVMKRFSIQLTMLVVVVVLLYFNWISWHEFVIGAVGLIVYYWVNTIVWSSIVERVLSTNKAWSRVFGFLVGFYLSAMAAGIPVVVWRYDRLSVALALFLVGLVGLLISALVNRHPEQVPRMRDEVKDLVNHTQALLTRFFTQLSRVQNDMVLFTILSALFIFFIFHARTGVYILSPWDALSSFVLMLFFVLTFIVVRMVFSGRSIGLVLAVIIIFSYMTHSYLTVIYETGFGGDKWRHLGAEQWVQEGNIYTPSIWGEERSTIHFGPIAVPEALVAGNKTSYAPQWSTTIFLAESLGVDIFWIDLLLVFLLWSMFLPLILFLFGRLIFENDRLGLLFAFLPTLFYTFQSEGAITIPVSFGHLFFFFVLLIWMFYAKSGKRSALYAASALSIIFYWGYILNFFVLIGVGILSITFRRLFLEKKHWYKFKLKFGFSDKRIMIRDRTIFVLLVIVSIFVIPFLEVFQGLSSYLPGSFSGIGILDALANSFGRLSGFIGVIVPPDFIDQGNFLYNQTKESLSRLPLFSYRVVPFIVSMIVWVTIAWGMYRLRKYYQDQKVLVLLGVLFLVALGSFFISWSFTEGVHILARRLNETIVFFMILFLGWGIWLFLEDKRIKIPHHKKVLAITFVLSFIATSTYASGPKLQLVTADELEAARVVWSEHQNDPEPYCVIANTWPLLGLEAVSGRKITAGNFPVYQEYAQPERVKIFEGMSKSPSQTWINGAFAVTDASVCYYMTENRWINDRVLDKTVDLLGEPRRVGEVYVWRLTQ
tara:strand:- start:3226 stop:5577 length:2352 start_codon:yes stop_codon:yes gene_type:complete